MSTILSLPKRRLSPEQLAEVVDWGDTNVWERQVRSLVQRYLDHARAAGTGEKFTCPYTQAEHGPDEKFLQKVEKYLGMSRDKALLEAALVFARGLKPELAFADLRLACRNVIEDDTHLVRGRLFLTDVIPPVYEENRRAS